MKFIDEAKILVTGGRGGDGCVSFRREKFVPRGGPDGGNGGSGGDVILQVDGGRNTLIDLKGKRHFRGGHGTAGGSQGKTGRCGSEEVIRVPQGTLVKDVESGEVLADLIRDGERFVVAQGGRGGRGNLSFVSSLNRAPRQRTSGEAGQERRILLELKLLADVGLIGRPNAGKSTLISRISAAKPKVADYPFTTLNPVLGVVSLWDHRSFTVADIPGLIEGASGGAGMGIRFLKHIDRTRLFLHLLDLQDPTQPDPWVSFQGIQKELLGFSADFSARDQWVVFTKLDLLQDKKQLQKAKENFELQGYRCFAISAATGEGLEELVEAVGGQLFKENS